MPQKALQVVIFSAYVLDPLGTGGLTFARYFNYIAVDVDVDCLDI